MQQILTIILILVLIFLSAFVSLLPYFYATTEIREKKNIDEEKKPN